MSRSEKKPAKAKVKKMDDFSDLNPPAYASGPTGTTFQHALEGVGLEKTCDELSAYWTSIQDSSAFSSAGDWYMNVLLANKGNDLKWAHINNADKIQEELGKAPEYLDSAPVDDIVSTPLQAAAQYVHLVVENGFNEDDSFLAELPDQHSRNKVVSQLFAKCIFNHNSYEHSLTKTLFPAILKGDFRRAHLQPAETRGRKRKSGNISREVKGRDTSTENPENVDTGQTTEQPLEVVVAKKAKVEVAEQNGKTDAVGFSGENDGVDSGATAKTESPAKTLIPDGEDMQERPTHTTATTNARFVLNEDFSAGLQGMISAARSFQAQSDTVSNQRDVLAQGIGKICGLKEPGNFTPVQLVDTLTHLFQDLDEGNRDLHGRNTRLFEELDKIRAELDRHEESDVALREELVRMKQRFDHSKQENEWSRADERRRANEHIQELSTVITALKTWKEQTEHNLRANLSGAMLNMMLPED